MASSVVPLRLLTLAGLIVFLFNSAQGQFENGATVASCITLQPLTGATSNEVDPFIIVPIPDSYTVPGANITVYVASTSISSYTGLIIQARRTVGGDTRAVGTFTVVDGLRQIACPGSPGGTLTNIDSTAKTLTLVLEWMAPEVPVGNIQFVATIVSEPGTFHEVVGNNELQGPLPILMIGMCPDDIAVPTGSGTSWTDPPCTNAITRSSSCTPQSGMVIVATSTVTCTCTDTSGNVDECSFVVTAIPVDQCTPNPCQNGGNCLDAGTTFFCQCFNEFTGRICENPPVSLCSPNPCQNSGICLELGSLFFCSCVGGFTGTTCDIPPVLDPCTPNPCENFGACLDAGNAFTCQCFGGFTGTTCDTPPGVGVCLNNPCLGNNECQESLGSLAGYTCHSVQGFPCL